MNANSDPIRHLLDAYQAAVLAKDVEAFVALYDTNVRVFDTWGVWSHVGIDAWRAMATEWFGSLGDETVAVEVADLQTQATADMAVGHAFLTFTAMSPAGVKLRSLNNRVTLVAERRGGAWKIVHEHTSSPADPDTLKVSLQRA